MDSKELEEEIKELRLKEDAASTSQFLREDHGAEHDAGLQITCFSEVLNDVTFHFQIIRLPKQADAEKLLIQKLISLGYQVKNGREIFVV